MSGHGVPLFRWLAPGARIRIAAGTRYGIRPGYNTDGPIYALSRVDGVIE